MIDDGTAQFLFQLEQLVRDMQDDEHGVPVRSQKLFLTSIPAAFMGYDLIEWLMDRLNIEDSREYRASKMVEILPTLKLEQENYVVVS